MRQFLLFAAKVTLSALLLYFALRNTPWAMIAERLANIQFGWMALGIASVFAQIAFNARRWQIVARHCGAPLDFAYALRLTTIGTFFNQTLPSASGGDAVRLWLMQRHGAGWQASSYSVLVDRALGLLALACVVTASLPWSLSLIRDPSGRFAILTIALISLTAGLGFLAFGFLNWRWLQNYWPTRHVHACSRIAWRALRSSEGGFAVLVSAVIIPVLAVVLAWCMARAISAPASFADLFLLVPPVLLLTMLPISIAGWGVRESAMVLAFSYAGLAQSDGLIVSLIFGVALFVVGIVGGIVWIVTREKNTTLRDIEHP